MCIGKFLSVGQYIFFVNQEKILGIWIFLVKRINFLYFILLEYGIAEHTTKNSAKNGFRYPTSLLLSFKFHL